MKKVLLLFALTVACMFHQATAQKQNSPYLYCILLDNTKSMIGKGGPDNIWDDVKHYCCDLIDETANTDVVWLYTFADDLKGPQKFGINSENDKIKAKDAVNALKAEGEHTYISKNLGKVLNDIDFSGYQLRLFLLTDGIEEGKDSFKEALRVFKMKNDRDVSYLYYVDLKNKASRPWKDAIEETPGAEHVVGFQKIIGLKPIFDNVSYMFNEETAQATTFDVFQYFKVIKGELTDDLSFEVSIPSQTSCGLNLDIIPSRVSPKIMKKEGEDGKYSVKFEVTVVNNVALHECSIPVVMKGSQAKNSILAIDPSSFTIELKPEIKVIHTTDTITDTVRKTVIIIDKAKVGTENGWE